VGLRAQLDDSSLRAPVRFKAVAKSPADQPIGEMTYFEAFLGDASIYGETWTRNTSYETSEATAGLYFGQTYTLHATCDDAYMDGPRWVYATIRLTVPGGYELRINGVPRTSIKMLPNEDATIQVIRLDRPGFVAMPFLPSVGKAIWQVGLGHCVDGTDAGSLEVRQDGLTGVYSPAALHYEGEAWYDVELVYSGGNIRQAKLPSRLVDVVTVTNGYELRFYAAGNYGTNKVNGVYPVNQGAQSFTRYFLENADPATGRVLRITQTTGTETDVLELYYDVPTQEWRRTLFRDGQVSSVQVQKQIQASPRIIEITTTNSAGVLAEKTRATYQAIGGGSQPMQVIIEEVRDYGGHNYTNQFLYDTNALNSSYQNKVWEKHSDGSWIKYEYYDGSIYDKMGLVRRTYEPFKDTPSGPENAATNSGVVTTYDYVSSADHRLNRLPLGREQWIDGKVVSRTTNTYTIEALPDGKTNIVRTTWEFYGTNTSEYIQSVEKRFDAGLPSTNAFYRGKLHARTEATGRRTAYLYQRGTWDGSTFTPGAGDYSRAFTLIGSSTSGTGSRLVQTLISTTNYLENVYLYPNQSMLAVEIRSPAGQVIRLEERVLTNATVGVNATLSDFALVGQTDATFDVADHLLTRTTLRGTDYTATYANGRLQTETDLAGTKTEFVWRDHGELRQTIRHGVTNTYSTQANLVTAFDYDAAGRLLTNTVGSGTERLISRQAYDLAGELTESVDVNGVVRTRALEKATGESHYSIERLLVMDRTVVPEQVLSEVEMRRHRDGRSKQSTGSGTVATYWSYAVPAHGVIQMTVNTGSSGSPRFQRTTSDMLGRLASTEVPLVGGGGTLLSSNIYSTTTGLLTRQLVPGQGDRYYAYDPFGRLQREGLDVDGGAGLQDSSKDRITEYDQRFVKDASNQWWLQQQRYGFPLVNQTTKIVLDRTLDRLTGFSGGVTTEA
jgi:hypothetical protein